MPKKSLHFQRDFENAKEIFPEDFKNGKFEKNYKDY